MTLILTSMCGSAIWLALLVATNFSAVVISVGLLAALFVNSQIKGVTR